MKVDMSKPLGLPEGTVRGIIALMIIGGCLYGYLILGGLPVGLDVAFGYALGYYFGVRASEKIHQIQS